jgi:hypothetical protein
VGVACGTISGMTEPGERTTWSFPKGAIGHDDSVKDYEVEATDGPVGTCSWASYKPGESYLVVSYGHGHNAVHHVVPAGAAKVVDHERRIVVLNVTAAEVKATPTHEEPEAPVDWGYVDQFERGMLGGGFVWPYMDV